MRLCEYLILYVYLKERLNYSYLPLSNNLFLPAPKNWNYRIHTSALYSYPLDLCPPFASCLLEAGHKNIGDQQSNEKPGPIGIGTTSRQHLQRPTPMTARSTELCCSITGPQLSRSYPSVWRKISPRHHQKSTEMRWNGSNYSA